MATSPLVVGARKSTTEAVSRVLTQRAELNHASGLLKPGEVAGEYNAARLLQTTLGGQLRALTHDDLRKFESTVKKLGKKFTGGITAKAVVDMSLKIDRDRSNEEIRSAVPMSSKGGVIHFVTNASKDSDVLRHHVFVEFLNFSAALASPGNPKLIAKQVTDGRLRYTCDCGRHTFWFSYLATVGKFAYGDPQVNFPKIRNPKLIGVACKHVLRVMQQLNMPLIRAQIEKMIEKGRTSLDNKPQALTKKEAADIVKQQAAQSHWKRNQVETVGEKRTRLLLTSKARATLGKAIAKVSAKTKDAALREFQSQLQVHLAKGVFTAAQVAAMLATIKK